MGYIYKITNNINNKIYIGYTTQEFLRRMNQHKNSAGVNNTLLANAIKKYGWDNFSYEIIDESENKEKLLELEQYYIKKYDCCILNGSTKGYNMTWGGEKLFGINNPFYGKTHTEETIQKLSEKGKQLVGEKNPFYGRHHTEETKEKIRKANSIPIAMLDDQHNIVKTFPSGAAARDYLLENNLSKDKTCNSTIVKAIKYDQKRYGYYWMYV